MRKQTHRQIYPQTNLSSFVVLRVFVHPYRIFLLVPSSRCSREVATLSPLHKFIRWLPLFYILFALARPAQTTFRSFLAKVCFFVPITILTPSQILLLFLLLGTTCIPSLLIVCFSFDLLTIAFNISLCCSTNGLIYFY